MEDVKPPLWLHAYAGKEHGLMIVGTPASMRELAQQLLDASDRRADSEAPAWPPIIAQPKIIGPYKDIPEFSLSFHLQGSAPLEKVTPLRRRTMWPPLFSLVAILTCVGAVTVFQWLSTLV